MNTMTLSLTQRMGLIVTGVVAIAVSTPLAHAQSEPVREEPSPLPHSYDDPLLVPPALSFPENVPLEQLTSVHQLSDVQAEDWAFEAVRSLVERYGVVGGYPDGTYRGQQSVSRYEFANAILTVLNQIEDLQTHGQIDGIENDDQVTLQRLQQEFAAELAILAGRFNQLEAYTTELEANQFSTTTQLSGQSILAFNDGFQGGDVDPNSIFLSRLRLNLITQFSPTNRLVTQLQMGQSTDDAASFLLREDGPFRSDLAEVGNAAIQAAIHPLSLDKVPDLQLNPADDVDTLRDTLALNLALLEMDEGRSPEDVAATFDRVVEQVDTLRDLHQFLRINSTLDYTGASQAVQIQRLSYEFSPVPTVRLTVFAQGFASDYVDTNRYANDSALDFSTYGFINNQLLLANDPPGAGAALQWQPSGNFFTLRAVYRAEAGAIASQVADDDVEGGIFGSPYLGVVEVEITPSEQLSLKLQYSGGTRSQGRDGAYNVVAANVAVSVNQFLGVFGRFGYAYNFPGDFHPASWAVGTTLSDLVIPGTLAGFAVGQPLLVQGDDLNFFDGVQTTYEAFYHLPFSDHLAITPVIQVITEPGNRERGAIVTGTLRMVVRF